MATKGMLHKPFGNQVPFCEPAWYQGQYTPYYTEKHVAFRNKVQSFNNLK